MIRNMLGKAIESQLSPGLWCQNRCSGGMARQHQVWWRAAGRKNAKTNNGSNMEDMVDWMVGRLVDGLIV